MTERINELESKQAELLSRVTPDDFNIWLSSATTKALLVQLEIDLENVKINWVEDRYTLSQETKAKGQASYINGLKHDIGELMSDD